MRKHAHESPGFDDHRNTRLLTKLEGEKGEASEPWSWFWEDMSRRDSWETEKRVSQGGRPGGIEPIMGALHREAEDSHIAKFAYREGERVEYYSKTNGMWLHADVFTELQQDAATVMYAVRMRGSNQRRRGVGFELLRPPLKKGEPCEVFSIKDGWWLVAKVAGTAAGTVPGYEVHLSQLPGAPASLSMVSAAVVRRRFPIGSRLVVYRGIEQGWVEAVAIAPRDDESEFANLESWAPEDGTGPSDKLDFGGSIEGPTMSTLSQATLAPAGSHSFRGPRKPDGSPLDCWVMVPLQEKGSEIREVVPSYLVRLHPEYLQELSHAESKGGRVPKEFDELDESLEDDTVEINMEESEASAGWWLCTCPSPAR